MTMTPDALTGVAALICAHTPFTFAVPAVTVVPVDEAAVCPTVTSRASELMLHSPISLEPEIREHPLRYLPHFVLHRRVDIRKFAVVYELLNQVADDLRLTWHEDP